MASRHRPVSLHNSCMNDDLIAQRLLTLSNPTHPCLLLTSSSSPSISASHIWLADHNASLFNLTTHEQRDCASARSQAHSECRCPTLCSLPSSLSFTKPQFSLVAIICPLGPQPIFPLHVLLLQPVIPFLDILMLRLPLSTIQHSLNMPALQLLDPILQRCGAFVCSWRLWQGRF
jgi:hypothetical protein